jgi:hypothetical protein
MLMTAIRFAVFCCLLSCVASRANAVAINPPTLYHDPATGRLWLTKPLGPPQSSEQGPIIYIKSASNSLLALAGNPIPGAIYDTEDFPPSHTFYNVPIGAFDLGLSIRPGVPSSDITLNYFPFLIPPFEPLLGAVVTIPEPASLATASVAFVALAVFRRRRYRFGRRPGPA